MSSTTDRYRRRHGDTAHARLAARASFAGLESLVAELVATSAPEPGTDPLSLANTASPVSRASPASTLRPGGSGSPVTRAGGTTPGPIPGRNTAGRALSPRAAPHTAPAPTTS